jgi:hypothetical protein
VRCRKASKTVFLKLVLNLIVAGLTGHYSFFRYLRKYSDILHLIGLLQLITKIGSQRKMEWFGALNAASDYWEEENPTLPFLFGEEANDITQKLTRRARVRWLQEEDTLLARVAVEMDKNWERIANLFPGKTAD